MGKSSKRIDTVRVSRAGHTFHESMVRQRKS